MIPEELKRYRQWVCAKRDSKNPWRADVHLPASVSDPSTWSSFEDADRAVGLGYYDNVGFVFRDNGIVGIDIDRGFDEDGRMSDLAVDIISTCGSYTERSRSGRGFHILLHGTLPFGGRNNGRGVEIYKTGRYFILTGDTDERLGMPNRLVQNQWGIDKVIDKYFPEMRNGPEIRQNQRVYNPKWGRPKHGQIPLRPEYPTIPQGSRNVCMASLAGLMHGKGYTKRQIYDELRYANERACKPALSDGELRSIVNSVTRYKR